MSDNELKKILLVSRRNNKPADITGILLYGNSRFIQMLEGPKNTVDETFKRIKSDQRHLDVTIIAWGELNQRCFPEWHMGYKPIRPQSRETIDGMLDLSKQSIERDDCEYPVKLLQSFVRKNKLDL